MRVLEHFKIIPFPLPLIETQCFWGFFCVFFFFLDIHCENLVELLEVKLIKVWGNSLWLGPPGTPHCFSELSTLSLWHLVNYNSGSPTPLLLSWRFLLVGFCSTKLWFSVFTCLSLSNFGGKCLPCNLVSLWLLQDWWFFSLFSILLVLC